MYLHLVRQPDGTDYVIAQAPTLSRLADASNRAMDGSIYGPYFYERDGTLAYRSRFSCGSLPIHYPEHGLMPQRAAWQDHVAYR